MKNKIYLGQVKNNFKNNKAVKLYHREIGNLSYIEGENIWLEKHSWDCDWYWGFGYIVNKDLHTHFDNVFLDGKGGLWWNCDEIFEETFLDDKKLWVLKDLFKQAYTLKSVAEVYQHGGHCTTTDDTKIIQDEKKASIANEDCEKVLDKIWELLTEWEKEKRD